MWVGGGTGGRKSIESFYPMQMSGIRFVVFSTVLLVVTLTNEDVILHGMFPLFRY